MSRERRYLSDLYHDHQGGENEKEDLEGGVIKHVDDCDGQEDSSDEEKEREKKHSSSASLDLDHLISTLILLFIAFLSQFTEAWVKEED